MNAHFQSGVAERRIRELQETARACLLHAQHRWKEAVNPHLWPYAVRTACSVYNEAPTKRMKRCPCEVFSGSKVMPNPNAWMPFGCPVYVLDDALQNNRRITGKWKHRSRVGVYLGRSPLHAATVALVLNLTTGRVSPQFHVQFDPRFQTMKASFDGRSPLSSWQTACGFSADSIFKPEGATPFQPEGATTTNVPSWHPEPVVEIPKDLPDFCPTDTEEDDDSKSVSTIGSLEEEPLQPPQEDETLRRSNRTRRPVERFTFEAMLAEVLDLTTDALGAPFLNDPTAAPGEIFSYKAMFGEEPDIPEHPLMAFAATNDPDTFYLHEAQREPDYKQFAEAMVKEIVNQWDNANFKLRLRSELKKGTPILPGVWALKRKRRILSGEVYKHKARWNLDGSKQVFGRDYEETYAPVAQWPVIRLMLIEALKHNYVTKQLDFVQAFPQAPISKKQFVELPKGVTIQGVNAETHVFEVLRNIYGGKDAGRQWFLHLRGKLLSIGFKQSAIDECLFYCGNVVFVLYTDDSIIMGPDEAEIDALIEKMKRNRTRSHGGRQARRLPWGEHQKGGRRTGN